MHERMSRNVAPLSFSLLAIAIVLLLGAMAPSADPEGGPPVADAGPDLSVDVGTEVLLDGTSSSDDGELARWVWTFPYSGQNVTLEGARASFTFELPGTYPVTLKVTDSDGEWSTDVVLVTVRGQ